MFHCMHGYIHVAWYLPTLYPRLPQPDLVKHFTWNSTIERQPGCREIDLSKSFSNTKDNVLRVIAEQLTLMEFAVYKAVKRRYVHVYTFYVCVWNTSRQQLQTDSIVLASVHALPPSSSMDVSNVCNAVITACKTLLPIIQLPPPISNLIKYM